MRLSHQWFELVATASATISYIVFRISREKKQREKNVGLEAESSASGGWKMNAVNDSETGRLRRVADAGDRAPYSLRKLRGEPGCTPLLVE